MDRVVHIYIYILESLGRASRGLDSLQNLAPRMSNTNWPGAVLAAVKTFVSAVKTDCVTSESHQRHFLGGGVGVFGARER